MVLWVGFDVGKAFHWVCALDGEGEVLLSRRVEATERDLEACLEEIAGLGDERSFGIDVAGFAKEVAEAARGGDRVSRGIWEDAAHEVALTASAALGRVFAPHAPVAVSWAGGLLGARDLMLQPFERRLRGRWPGAKVRAPEGTALDGAGLLASVSPSPMFAALKYDPGR